MYEEFNFFIRHCFEKNFSKEEFLVCVCVLGGGVCTAPHTKVVGIFFVIY
jgi:hypothetical protein